MAIAYESLIRFTISGLSIVIVLLILYYIRKYKQMDKWERRILILALFFAVHGLSFFLSDAFIYQLTEMFFVIGLLYALLYVFSFERKLEEAKEQRKELLMSLEEIRNIKEIREKLESE